MLIAISIIFLTNINLEFLFCFWTFPARYMTGLHSGMLMDYIHISPFQVVSFESKSTSTGIWKNKSHVVVVQSISHVRLFATPWTVSH